MGRGVSRYRMSKHMGGTHGYVLVLQHDLEDVAQLIEQRLGLLLSSPGCSEEGLVDHRRNVSPVSLDELVEIAIPLRNEILELLPLTRNDLEMAIIFDLADEEDHVAESDAGLVKCERESCRDEP